MYRRLLSGLVLGVVTVSPVSAQFMVRAGVLGGRGTGEWGPVWGALVGIDELVPSRSYGWWSSRLDIAQATTRLADEARLAHVKVVNVFTTPPDTLFFGNSFRVTTITAGGRYEPCRHSLGFRQTPNRIVSPFVGWHLGYSRFEHERRGRAPGVSGLATSHGVPVGGSVGLLVGWGGPPAEALDPNVSSQYWGMEISLDVSTTVWLKNGQIIAPMSSLPAGLDAPGAPTVTFQAMFMYRTAPVRKR